jgi:hypothetical protein
MHTYVAEPRCITSLPWAGRLGRSLTARFRVVGMEDLATFRSLQGTGITSLIPSGSTVSRVDHDKTTI